MTFLIKLALPVLPIVTNIALTVRLTELVLTELEFLTEIGLNVPGISYWTRSCCTDVSY
jgi:hypothetical protein